jgi:hypothetical protein
MGLFIASPPTVLAACFFGVGSHAGAILTPANEADAGIWAADAAVEVVGEGQRIPYGRTGFYLACFCFRVQIIVHDSAPFSEKQKSAAFFEKDSTSSFFHLCSCVVR